MWRCNYSEKLKKEEKEATEEEASRAKDLKGRIIEEIEEHTPDTFANLEATLKRGLGAIEEQRKRLTILAKPLP